jgi:hypothetical protein
MILTPLWAGEGEQGPGQFFETDAPSAIQQKTSLLAAPSAYCPFCLTLTTRIHEPQGRAGSGSRYATPRRRRCWSPAPRRAESSFTGSYR